MSPLNDFPPLSSESRADYVARVAPSVRGRARYIGEVLELMGRPATEAEGIAFACEVPILSAAPEIHMRLQLEFLQANCYNIYMLALGQIGYAPAANTIEAYFLRGKTKAAAAVALLLLDAERAKAPFDGYAHDNPELGARLAAVGLTEFYARRGIEGLEERLDAIPTQLLRRCAQLIKPEGLRKIVQCYARRT